MDLETLYDAWERYKDLLRRCQHHGLPLWLQVQTFYNGVNPSTRQMIDATTGGTINNRTPEVAYEFIEEMSLNNYQWQVMRTKPTKTTGVYNVDAVHPVMRCDSSGGGVFNPTTKEEQVHYMGNNNSRSQNNPYSNTYNVGWRNHPNFLWGGQENQRPQNPPGSLPSNTEPNPREQLNAINISNEEGLVASEPGTKQETVESKDKGKIDHNGLKPMPNEMKFLKELLTNKRKLDEASHVELNAVCSAILQNKLPNKLKDLGSFTIPCLIGSLDMNNTLADLEPSINVMPYKMFKQPGLGKPKQTWMSIQLVDKTIRFPRGIVEDVLVKIDKFIFPVDFVFLGIEEDSNVPLILGRPFLATARTIIYVGTGELTFVWETKQSPFKLAIQAISSKDIHEPCSSNNKGPIHEERRLQIEELDEWRTHKLKTR
ncbi:hypothetical protein CXB51_017300 [Gossypium anomalum]|uniref:Retrotransposon gag domain-containing protein n=1 Tax=Gossypium anomalum TaxID=47600 RepID=A0A8J5YFE0_9ROSI|nr:hypothetical protein CXB51_017300 [Gossypium anomalum]